MAGPVDGARETLAVLAGRYRVVAIVSGRPANEIDRLLAVPGVRFVGLYGLGPGDVMSSAGLLSRVEGAAARVPEAWVEDKGSSVAVHYRQAPDPPRTREDLLGPLREVADAEGLELVEGKMVLELVPAGRPRKGGAVERMVAEHELEAALFAGDDVADLDAFEALDRLAVSGLVTLKVAVAGEETPAELLGSADVIVDGPPGLVDLLRHLA